MRTYCTTSVKHAQDILRSGFADLYEDHGLEGLCFCTRPLNGGDGVQGDVTLCMDIPEAVFRRFELTGGMPHKGGYRLALVPASVLNGIGEPQIDDNGKGPA
jgi:hypothetical protein